MANLNDVVKKLDDILNRMDTGRGINFDLKDGDSGSTENLIAALKSSKSSDAGGKGSGKGAIMSAIGREIVGAVRETLGILTKGFSAYYDIQKTNIRAEKAIMSKRLELYSDTLKKASENAVAILTGDLADAMYSSFKNTLDFGLSQMNKRIEMRQIEYDRVMQNQITNMNALNGVVGGAIGTAGKYFSSSGAPWAVIVGSVLGTAQEIMRAGTELEAMKLQAEQTLVHEMNDLRKEFNERMYGLAETQIKLGEGVDKMLMNLDKGSYEMARGLGIGAQAAIEYKNAVLDANIQMAALGKTWEDMLKIQQSYVDNAGRNTLLTSEGGARTSAIAMLFGISDTESGGLMGAMNIFNKSIESGSDMMFTMYKTATRMGVSNQRFAKELQNALKISQRYQFKDGVRGVMEMALWAQKVRMNMGDVESAIGKIRTGNIEDVIQTSARLNVLGGNAALMSDPMAMLYNAYADPKKFMENINKMVKGFGTVNRATGETTFSIAEQMRIEQIANATGTSAESLMNQARQANKVEAIKRRFGNKFGKDIDYIANNALYDEKQGTWVINVLGEGGKARQTTLDRLNKEEIENIFPEDSQEQLLTYVGKMLSIMEEQHKTENSMRAILMGETAADHATTHRGIYRRTIENFEKNKDWNIQNVLDIYAGLRESMELQFKLNDTMAASYRENGNTLLKIISDMSNAAFGENIVNFSDMIKAFMGGREGMLQYWKKHDPAVYEAELKASGNTTADIIRKTGGSNPLGGAAQVMKWIVNPFSAIGDYKQGSLLANVFGENAGRYIGTQMKKGTLSGYGNYDNARDAAQAALETGVFDIGPNGEIVWGRHANEIWSGAGAPFQPVLDKNGNPLVIKRDKWMGYRSSSDTKRFWDIMGTARANIAQDAIITPRGTVYTHPNDTIMAFKPGGPIMNSMNGGNSRVEVSGTLRLETNGQSIDLMELVNSDPTAWTRLTEGIIEKGFQNKYGRSPHAPQRYTFG